MKTKLYLLLFMFIPCIMVGQTSTTESDPKNESQPSFTGILKKAHNTSESNNLLGIFVCDNFICPDVSLDCLREGTVVVRFKVIPSGELTDFEVSNSVCPAIDAELVRIIKSTEGMWIPGSRNGSPVAKEQEVSMMFVKNPYIENPKDYFIKVATTNFNKGNKLFLDKSNPEKALKYYDTSIKYRPNEASSLLLRGLCRYVAGDKEGACNDWNRINVLGNANVDEYLENLCGLEGYNEMASILNQ